MKYKILAVFTVLILIFSFPVSAAQNEYTVDFDKSFTVGYTSGNMSAIAQITEMDESALKDYCTENNIEFVAVNSDNTVQMRLYVYSTELSKSAKDLSALSDSSIEKLVETLGEKGYTTEKVGYNNYIKTEQLLSDSGGTYLSSQYITVKNGKIYQFSIYSEGQTENEKAKKSLENFTFKKETVKVDNSKKIIVGCVFGVLLIIIVIMIMGIIKDIKSND